MRGKSTGVDERRCINVNTALFNWSQATRSRSSLLLYRKAHAIIWKCVTSGEGLGTGDDRLGSVARGEGYTGWAVSRSVGLVGIWPVLVPQKVANSHRGGKHGTA